MAIILPGYGHADAAAMRKLNKLTRQAFRRVARTSFSRQKIATYLFLRRLAAVLLPGKEKIKVARQLSGKSALQQLIDRTILFFGYRIDARDYYDLSLFMPDLFVRAGEYQGRKDIAFINTRINQNETTKITEDKKLFHDLCIEHGIPTPRIVAMMHPDDTAKDSLVETLADTAQHPGLFFKPQFGLKGAGVGRLSYNEDRQIGVDMGKGLQIHDDWDTVFDTLAALDEPLVFQEILKNHSILAQFNPDILHTLRLTTYSAGNDFHFLTALLRIGLGDRNTDNISVGGLGVPVDIESGRLFYGTQKSVDILPLSLNGIGDRSTDLETIQLPFLKEALEMAKAVHTALPQIFSLGHDIAILPDGPVAVETNHIWGDFQKFQNQGYGADRTYIANLIDRCQNHPDFS